MLKFKLCYCLFSAVWNVTENFIDHISKWPIFPSVYFSFLRSFFISRSYRFKNLRCLGYHTLSVFSIFFSDFSRSFCRWIVDLVNSIFIIFSIDVAYCCSCCQSVFQEIKTFVEPPWWNIKGISSASTNLEFSSFTTLHRNSYVISLISLVLA